jgi:hypothetical protein
MGAWCFFRLFPPRVQEKFIMSADSQEYYIDLLLNGMGYLSRIREVPAARGKRHKPFLACLITALNGPSNDVSKKYIDCTVPAEDAAHLVRKCKDAVDSGKKVLIWFRLGDPWIDTFVYKSGDRKGQPGYSWKARLIFIRRIKIDAEIVYDYDTESGDPAPADAAADGSSEAQPAASDGNEGGAVPQSAPPLAA